MTGSAPGPGPERLRLDKWLWMARFFKTRARATEVVAGAHVRVNGQKVAKKATLVGAGDVLTFAQGREVRVVRITGLPTRRGPAPEAQALYDDLTPKPDPETAAAPDAQAPRRDAKGRPTKRDRRQMGLARDAGPGARDDHG